MADDTNWGAVGLVAVLAAWLYVWPAWHAYARKLEARAMILVLTLGVVTWPFAAFWAFMGRTEAEMAMWRERERELTAWHAQDEAAKSNAAAPSARAS